MKTKRKTKASGNRVKARKKIRRLLGVGFPVFVDSNGVVLLERLYDDYKTAKKYRHVFRMPFSKRPKIRLYAEWEE